MKDYHINIFQSDEDGGYIADIPDLPHCSAFGETPEKALEDVLKQRRLGWMPPRRRVSPSRPRPSGPRSIRSLRAYCTPTPINFPPREGAALSPETTYEPLSLNQARAAPSSCRTRRRIQRVHRVA